MTEKGILEDVSDDGSFESMQVDGSEEPRSRSFDLGYIDAAFKTFGLSSLISKSLVLVGLVFFVCSAVYYSAYSPPTISLPDSSQLTTLANDLLSIHPHSLANIRSKIHSTTLKARQGPPFAVFPTPTLMSHIENNNIEFVLYRLVGPPRVRSSASEPSTGYFDPLSLANMDRRLIVLKFNETIGYDYTLVLNKFNVVSDHCLIIADAFKVQASPLTHNDLAVWFLTLNNVNAVGFFNSNKRAGASQRHKHMQLIPQDVLWHLRSVDAEYATVLDELVLPRIENKRYRSFPRSISLRDGSRYLGKIPEFASFAHALAVLDPSAVRDFTAAAHSQLDSIGEYLERVYLSLLRHLKIDRNILLNCAEGSQPKFSPDDCEAYSAYNLVLTQHYMLMVPRSQLGEDEINGMAYLGLFLTSTEERYQAFRKVGAFATLQSVGRSPQ